MRTYKEEIIYSSSTLKIGISHPIYQPEEPQWGMPLPFYSYPPFTEKKHYNPFSSKTEALILIDAQLQELQNIKKND